jgi:hypothetical protein
MGVSGAHCRTHEPPREAIVVDVAGDPVACVEIIRGQVFN